MGIAGWLIDLGDAGADTRLYSIVSTAGFVGSQADAERGEGSVLGVWIMCLLFAVTAFVVPVLQLILLSSMWHTPLSLRWLYRHM